MIPDAMFNDLLRKVTALQKQVDRIRQPEVGGWVDFTPAVTQGVSVAVTVTHARYMTINKLVVCRGRLTCTGAGTLAQTIIVSGLPYGAKNANGAAGVIDIADVSAGIHYNGPAIIFGSATQFIGWITSQAAAIGAAPPFALANTDRIDFDLFYERD